MTVLEKSSRNYIHTENNTKAGVVIVGYQGIGKSTLAKTYDKVIDLESSNYYVHGQRPIEWEYMYANTAMHLASQNKIVFVSSHAKVREYLRQMYLESPSNVYLFSVVPAIHLENQWLDKLRCRFQETSLDKDYRAYMNALDCYRNNIIDIIESPIECIQIDSIDYDLQTILNYKFSSCGLNRRGVIIN